MPTDQVFLFLWPILFGFLWVALQMTGSKLLGLVMMFLSLESLWWLLEPTLAIFWWGSIAILFLCGLYGWWICEPVLATIPSPQVSSTNQSGGITGNYSTIVINQAHIAKVPITEPVTTFEKEGNAIVLTLQHLPIPDSIYLLVTSMTYWVRASTEMSVRGRKIYIEDVGEKKGQVYFFDLLPDVIPEGSVSVQYHRSSSPEELEEIKKKQ